MQAWAGAGWGTQFIPRVGMEVVVAFEAGDPDKPIVLGAVYNAASPPAFPLPRDKSKSGFRTRSTPDGDGFNELSFEDSTGAERVFMRAQRDLDTHVERDRNTIVLGRDNTRVDGDSTRAVSGVDRTVASGTRAAEIGGDDSIHVRGHRNVIVGRDLDEHVSGDRRVRVEHDDFREIMGEAVLTAHGGVTGDLRGSASVVVGRHDAKRSLATRVEGTANLSASEVLDLDSDKEVVLRCGTSAIRMTANAIELTADTVTLRGKDSRVLLADGEAKVKTKSLFQVVSDDKVVIVSSGASIGLGAEVKVDGAKILLNSPNRATDDLTADEAETTTIELVDQDGNAVPGERYRLVLDDGTEITGVLDDAGKATVYAKTSGQIEFPDMAEAERA